MLEINSIISTYGNNKKLVNQYAPPLNNRTLLKEMIIYVFIAEISLTPKTYHEIMLLHIQGGKDLWVMSSQHAKDVITQKLGEHEQLIWNC